MNQRRVHTPESCLVRIEESRDLASLNLRRQRRVLGKVAVRLHQNLGSRKLRNVGQRFIEVFQVLAQDPAGLPKFRNVGVPKLRCEIVADTQGIRNPFGLAPMRNNIFGRVLRENLLIV